MQANDEQVATKRRQADTAIQLALASRWEEAVEVNKSILSLYPDDGDSHNRLGKAFMELGRYNNAKKSYRKALQIDPTNQIAKKNLERLTALAKSGAAQAETTQVDPMLFIEEMGKTVVTTLQQTTPEVLTTLNAGEAVELRPKGGKLQAVTPGGDFVGLAEPNLGNRLIKLLEGGNEYASAITHVDADECQIIIKETHQDPSRAGRPSFPTTVSNESLRPYTKQSLVRHETQPDDTEKGDLTDDDDEIAGEGKGNRWENERVIQEGHVRLNDAAAAEDNDDELEE